MLVDGRLKEETYLLRLDFETKITTKEKAFWLDYGVMRSIWVNIKASEGLLRCDTDQEEISDEQCGCGDSCQSSGGCGL